MQSYYVGSVKNRLNPELAANFFASIIPSEESVRYAQFIGDEVLKKFFPKEESSLATKIHKMLVNVFKKRTNQSPKGTSRFNGVIFVWNPVLDEDPVQSMHLLDPLSNASMCATYAQIDEADLPQKRITELLDEVFKTRMDFVDGADVSIKETNPFLEEFVAEEDKFEVEAERAGFR